MIGVSWQALDLKGVCWQDVPGGSVAYMPQAKVPSVPMESVLVMGAFDGLHRGHGQLVEHAVADAQERGVACVAVTFDPDPSQVVDGDCAEKQLLCLNDRVCGLLRMGVGYVVVLRFTRDLMMLGPAEFVDEVLLPLARPLSVHVGSNFHFGHKGAGDGSTLAQIAFARGFSARVHDLTQSEGQIVSSTRIRGLLKDALLKEANELLGRCHYVRGVVEHGRGEATSFGFPTANVRCNSCVCMPAEGVYACYVTCGDSAWPAAANVGAPPTFSGPDAAFLEANLLGFEGNLYGREVTVSFVHWLRASRKFDSIEELERVVLGNIEWVRRNLGQSRIEVSA